MFDNEARRKHGKMLTSLVESMMMKITGNQREIAGWLVFIIHTLVVGIVYYLLLWTSNKTGFVVGLVIWITFVLQHLYFDGCWGVKSERHIWRAKDWYGPWTVLFDKLHKLGMPSTKAYHNVFFILFTLVLTTLVIERWFSFYK